MRRWLRQRIPPLPKKPSAKSKFCETLCLFPDSSLCMVPGKTEEKSKNKKECDMDKVMAESGFPYCMCVIICTHDYIFVFFFKICNLSNVYIFLTSFYNRLKNK